jgi:hypothetical protein
MPVDDAAYRLDLPKETTMMINSDEEVGDVGRSLLPKELHQRRGEKWSGRRWSSIRGLEGRGWRREEGGRIDEEIYETPS